MSVKRRLRSSCAGQRCDRKFYKSNRIWGALWKAETKSSPHGKEPRFSGRKSFVLNVRWFVGNDSFHVGLFQLWKESTYSYSLLLVGYFLLRSNVNASTYINANRGALIHYAIFMCEIPWNHSLKFPVSPCVGQPETKMTVPHKGKPLWSFENDVLEPCNKNGIQHFLHFGSALQITTNQLMSFFHLGTNVCDFVRWSNSG